MSTFIMDSIFNSVPGYMELAKTVMSANGNKPLDKYVLISKRDKNTSYPGYVIDLGQINQLNRGVYITTSRSRAVKASKTHQVVFLDVVSALPRDKFTIKKGIVRISGSSGLQRVVNEGLIYF